ncbi:hypothetical protein GI584_14200 [Gracilibacillus salitolerans]|uniref:Uncharacterized protein n=1 Tax=Gracilibacillus salitolerans TaxID=2663022 RepID=A0A5Q2TJL4_9BACI|nr:hypothetical protein [Gracilibacillus salitolerans]QGH35124.1 hypothetical protein GI584_14200 [Gracilibacillus salitolerans]
MRIILSIVLIILPTLIFGYLDKTEAMTTSLIAGFVSAVFLNLDRFESFKAGNFEAKLKQTEKLLGEAKASIDQLKEMVEPLMNYTMVHILRGNSVIGAPAKDKEKLYLRIKENSRIFKIDNHYHNQLLRDIKMNMIKTYFYEIEFESDSAFGWDKLKPLREFIDKYKIEEQNEFPSVDEIKKFFRDNPDLHNNKVEKRIEDYQRALEAYWN